ncbi:holo-ACP synthase [Treponema sp. C6A8]|uniref:holo-ACP synthase n=1 Tax=Treponema sp. C6A8 TaxID=1410609 RepID=UPI00048994B4|nr:holo-ACP synthase [Treponema sp. C6A8]
MIFGIGTDIAEVRRFEKWVKNPQMFMRFFNSAEIMDGGSEGARCQHYAVRFAAKEAFAKAIGTGIAFDLKDVFITKDQLGKPFLNVQGSAKKLLEEKAGLGYNIHVSLSHEKEYALAFVVIETDTKTDAEENEGIWL